MALGRKPTFILRMKRIFQFIVAMALPVTAFANHIESAYLSYRHLSGNSYEIALRTTEGCYGVYTTSYAYGIQYGSTVLNETLHFYSERMSTPLGPACNTNCQTTGAPFLSRELVFKDTIDLSSTSDCHILLSCSIATRGGSLMGPFENMYVFTEFNRCLGTSNSSPVFKELRQILHYNLEDYLFYEPIDSFDNRDSLSLSLLQPALKGPNTWINYPGNYSPQRPLNYTGFPNTPLVYSNNEGWIRITPSTANQFRYLAGDLYEWVDSSGVMVLASRTHFDHVVIVAYTPTMPAPNLTFLGGGAGANGSYNPCTDTVQHLDYILSDSTDTLSYFIKADAPITYSVIDTNAGYKHIRISVSIPDSLMLDTFFVRIYAKDNNCLLAKERNFLLPFVRFPKPSQFTHPQLDSAFRCNGYRLSLSDPAQQDLTFRFSNNKDTQSVYFQQTGYQRIPIRVTTPRGCYVDIQDSVYLNSFNQLQSNAGHAALEDCPGTAVPFHVSPSGGTAPYQVKWNNTDTNYLYTAYIPDAVFPDTLLLDLKITDAFGCIKKDTFLLINKPKVFGDIGGNGGVRCHGNGPLEFFAGAALGTPPYIYNWFTLGTQKFIQVDPSKDTLIFLEVTDCNGCTSMDSMQIIRYAGPVANAGSDQSVCSGTTVTLQAGANPGMSASYNWLGIGAGAGISFKPVSSGFVRLEVSDSLGCRHYDSLYVTVHSKPDLTIQGPAVACEHETVSFTSSVNGGTAPFQYTWTGGPQNGSSANYSFSATQSGPVHCFVLDSNGCRDTVQRNLTVFSFDTIVFQPGQLVYCEDQQFFSLINRANPKGGTWSGTGVQGTQFSPDHANPGQHVVYYTIGTGQCFDKDSLIFDVRPKAVLNFVADNLYGTAPLLVQFTNNTPGNYTWSWDFGDPQRQDDTSSLKNPSYTYLNGGIFSPKLVADNGACRDSIRKQSYLNFWHTGLEAVQSVEYLIYPNPFSNSLTLGNPEELPLTWKLYTAQGQLLEEGTFEGGDGRIDTEKLAAGLYLLQVNGQTRVVVKEK